MQFTKKKRKRDDSGSDVDLEITPPPSPRDDDPAFEKRRSGRNTNKRKKYVDDVDLNLSEDENILANLPDDIKAEITNSESNSNSMAPNAIKVPVEGIPVAPGGNSVPPTDASIETVVTDQAGPNYAFIVSIVHME